MSSVGFSVIIPARRASSRLPNKPLLDIAGLPMVVRVARQALQSGARRVVVATDDLEIADTCALYGIESTLTDAQHPSGSDRLAQACETLSIPDNDIVVNVQGDEPLIPPNLIYQVAETLQGRPDCAMSTAAHPIHESSDFLNPHVVKTILDARGTALYFSRAPIPWWRDGYAQGVHTISMPAPLKHLGIYAYRCHFLKQFPSMPIADIERLEALEQLRVLWHGHRIAVHVTQEQPGTGVDTPQDLERVRRFLNPS